MMNNLKFSKTAAATLLVVFILGLTSCRSIEIDPGSERLRVFEQEPKGCLYMGEVSSVQDNKGATRGKDAEMTLDTRIDLRNKAHKLNGNILVFMSKSRAKLANTNTTVADVATKKDAKPEARTEAKTDATKAQAASNSVESETTEHSVFLATVFRCPPLIFNQ